MRATNLSILSRLAALLLVCGLSACASGGGVAPSPEFLASQPPAKSLNNAAAPVEAPSDVADLPEGTSETADPY